MSCENLRGTKKGSHQAPLRHTTARLELVNQTQRDDIVSTDTRLTGEFIFINQVDFVIHVGGHVFVEVVSRTHINIFQQILIAEVFDVFAFRLQVSHGWTQAEVELVLSNHFEVLRFVSKAVSGSWVAAVRGTKTGCVVGLRVLCCQIDVVGIVLQATRIDFCVIPFTVYAQCVLIGGTFREGANKRGNSSRLTQSFHFFMFEPIFSPVNALNQPI